MVCGRDCNDRGVHGSGAEVSVGVVLVRRAYGHGCRGSGRRGIGLRRKRGYGDVLDHWRKQRWEVRDRGEHWGDHGSRFVGGSSSREYVCVDGGGLRRSERDDECDSECVCGGTDVSEWSSSGGSALELLVGA